MSVNIQEKMIHLFEKATDEDMKFEKTVYPEVFKDMYEEYKDMLEAITEEVEQSTDKEAVLQKIAHYIPDYAAEQKIDSSLPKRKKEMILLDYNMAMATFVLPLFQYHTGDACKQVGEYLVKIWNDTFDAKIRNSSYEQISNGFQQRLCYITTAVCKSFGKADDCYELETLRAYRDEYLIEEGHGRALVQEYYNTAPTIVKRIDRLENASEIYHNIWDTYLLPCIHCIEEKKEEECKEVYSNMVHELQKKYLYQSC